MEIKYIKDAPISTSGELDKSEDPIYYQDVIVNGEVVSVLFVLKDGNETRCFDKNDEFFHPNGINISKLTGSICIRSGNTSLVVPCINGKFCGNMENRSVVSEELQSIQNFQNDVFIYHEDYIYNDKGVTVTRMYSDKSAIITRKDNKGNIQKIEYFNKDGEFMYYDDYIYTADGELIIQSKLSNGHISCLTTIEFYESGNKRSSIAEYKEVDVKFVDETSFYDKEDEPRDTFTQYKNGIMYKKSKMSEDGIEVYDIYAEDGKIVDIKGDFVNNFIYEEELIADINAMLLSADIDEYIAVYKFKKQCEMNKDWEVRESDFKREWEAYAMEQNKIVH